MPRARTKQLALSESEATYSSPTTFFSFYTTRVEFYKGNIWDTEAIFFLISWETSWAKGAYSIESIWNSA